MHFGRKKNRKHRFINGVKGSISIFLCITVLPFLSIASALIEYSRYQSAIELANEVSDCASLSALADYDEYIHDRFGLFALSQDADIADTYESAFGDNIELLGNEVSTGDSLTARGVYPLTDTTILKNQITDFGECTVLSEVLLEDFNLQDILDKLGQLDRITDFLDSIQAIADLTDALKKAVDAAKDLKKALQDTVNQIQTVKTNAQAFCEAIANFYSHISTLPSFPLNGTLEEEKAFFDNNITEEWIQDNIELLKAIYSAGRRLYNSCDTLKTYIQSIPGYLDTFSTEMQNAADVLAQINSSEESETESESKAAANPLIIVFNELKNSLDSAVATLKDETLAAIQGTIDGLTSSLRNSFMIFDVENYFKWPLTDDAKDALEVLFENRPSQWNENSFNEVLTLLKSKFFPNIDISDFSAIKDAIDDAITRAENNLKSKLGEAFRNFITSLVNTARNLFKLDVFYDPDLNAYLSMDVIAKDPNNPYQNFLDSIGGMLTAVQDFVDGLKNWNIFGIFNGIKNFLKSVKDAIQATIGIVTSFVQNIGNLISMVAHGKGEDLYDLFLTAGYMTHNLPNRTCNGDITHSDAQYYSTLSGEALTGFQYKDIPTAGSSTPPGMLGGLLGMSQFLQDLKNQSGSDRMFKGAELEYIAAGTNSEVANQVITFLDIYMLRLVLNLFTLLSDADAHEMAAAATIACWAVYLIIIVAEPFCDMVLMVNGSGKAIPLIKKDLYLSPTGLGRLVIDLADVLTSNQELKDSVNQLAESKFTDTSEPSTFEELTALDYESYILLILLMRVDCDTMLSRFCDIVRLESTEYYRRKGASFTFDINKTYTCIESTANITFHPFIDAFGLENSGISGTIKKTRGY